MPAVFCLFRAGNVQQGAGVGRLMSCIYSEQRFCKGACRILFSRPGQVCERLQSCRLPSALLAYVCTSFRARVTPPLCAGCSTSGPPLPPSLSWNLSHNVRSRQVVGEMRKALEAKGVGPDEIAVRGSSHFGGHKYAGVLIIYPQGDW